MKFLPFLAFVGLRYLQTDVYTKVLCLVPLVLLKKEKRKDDIVRVSRNPSQICCSRCQYLQLWEHHPSSLCMERQITNRDSHEITEPLLEHSKSLIIYMNLG